MDVSVLTLGQVQFLAVAQYFTNNSLADHTLPTCPDPLRQKMAQSPLNGVAHPVDIEDKIRSSTMDRQWLKLSLLH